MGEGGGEGAGWLLRSPSSTLALLALLQMVRRMNTGQWSDAPSLPERSE